MSTAKKIEGLFSELEIALDKIKFLQVCLDTMEHRVTELEEMARSGEIIINDDFDDEDWDDE